MNSTQIDTSEMPSTTMSSLSTTVNEQQDIPSIVAPQDQIFGQAGNNGHTDDPGLGSIAASADADDGPPKVFVSSFKVLNNLTLAPGYFTVHPFVPGPGFRTHIRKSATRF